LICTGWRCKRTTQNLTLPIPLDKTGTSTNM
jgi:hypothetical protein